MNKLYYVKLIVVFLFVTAIIWSLFLLIFGKVHLISSLLLHFAFFFILSYLLNRIFKKWKKSNLRLTFWATFISIILLELSLRFIFQHHLSYSEKNESQWFTNPFKYPISKVIRNKKHKMDAGLYLNSYNDCRIDNKHEFTIEHCYNNYGIRDENYSEKEIQDSKVILALGDSFTEGVGAISDSTWPKLLENKLQKKDSIVKIINCGTSGSDIVFEWYKLKNIFIEAYRPDIVILAINNSDITDLLYRGGTERFVSPNRLEYNKEPWWFSFYSISHVFRYFIHHVCGVDWHYFTDEEYERKENNIEKIMIDMIENDFYKLSKDFDFKFIVVFTPMQAEVESEALILEDVYEAIDISDTTFMKISFIDEFICLKEKCEIADYYWESDLHCKPAGYNAWAEYIYDEIENKKWF